jgi:3-oxoacyl-[acyl-carrier protein] reductase
LQGIIDAHGRLDTLVSNAGIALDGLVIRLKDDDWQRLLAINLTAPLTLSRVAARCMMRQRDGAVVHVSSVVGETGNAGQVGYATTKAGILGLVKSLARELGPRGVRVNAVAPGLIDTDMTAHLTPEAIQALLGRVPLGRAGTADEVAHAVSFLASPAAGYITGEVLRVNGGLHM